ncbi:DUF3508 domain-containing protein, partial [archaeon]
YDARAALAQRPIEQAHATSRAATTQAEAERITTACNDVCAQYVDTLQALRCGAIAVPASVAGTWPNELANRRQLAVYAASLGEELRGHSAELGATKDKLQAELDALRSLVGGRNSVSKEAVYPHFHNLAAHWFKLAEVAQAVDAVAAALNALAPFTPPTVCTLPLDVVRAARTAAAAGAVDVRVQPPAADAASAGDDKPVALSLERSPEFLQLPLDYQGYCPVSLATAVLTSSAEGAPAVPASPTTSSGMGILLPGDPSLGVLRWRGRHVVCANAAAFDAFCAAPAYYTSTVQLLALSHIELVHLLQLCTPGSVDGFPEASLPLLLQSDGDVDAAAASLRAVATPTTAAAAAAAATATTMGGGSGGGGAADGGVRIGKSGARMGTGVSTLASTMR